MTDRTAVIIRCADLVRHVIATADSVAGQTRTPDEIAVVVDGTTPDRANEWLEALARDRGWQLARAGADSPGAAWNAGMRATTADVVTCLEAGDSLQPDYLAVVLSALDAQDTSAVSGGLLGIGPPRCAVPLGGRAAPGPIAVDPTIPALTVRRATWAALGGFNESLPALTEYEFCLRAGRLGHRHTRADDAIVIREWRADGLYRRRWLTGHHVESVDRVLRAHPELFEEHLESLLVGSQRLRAQLRIQNRDLVAGRARDMEEIEGLRVRAAALRDLLPEAERQQVDLGDLHRTTPVARDWGYERGGPIDRPYIEAFMEQHASDVTGAVLEIQEADYTRRFGGSRVTRSDVLDLDTSNPHATIYADLRKAPNIPSDTYDCIILTQTLHVIDDMSAVVAECARILKPGGVLLATLPCASRVSLEYGPNGDFWRVTEAGARRTFARVFPAARTTVESKGNVLVNAAFLYSLGKDELSQEDYAAFDPYLPALVTVRAQKPPRSDGAASWWPAAHVQRSRPPADHSGSAVLMYHRVASPASDIHHLAVSKDEFHLQMAYIREHYEVVSLAELARFVRARTLQPGTLAVTFDDGYVDNLTEASPVLSSMKIPATFFLTTDRLADVDAYEYWWDSLEDLLLGAAPARPDDLWISLPGGEQCLPVRTSADRVAAYWTIYHAIAGAPADVRDDVVAAVRQSIGRASDLRVRRMTTKELVELSTRPGQTIGAHSGRHLMLPRQPAEVQRTEIEESKRTLEAIVGHSITAFAYPFGAWDSCTRDLVRIAGFDVAVACEDGAIPRHPDIHALPRLDVAAKGSERFDDWLRRRVGPSRLQRPSVVVGALNSPDQVTRLDKRAIVAGWFSYKDSDSTAGDLLAADLVGEWLAQAGIACDVALAPPFRGGVDLDRVDPANYTHAVFVCGPFMPNHLERQFLDRFRDCVLVGVNLTLPVPLSEWNPFDVLMERDSSRAVNPDITFASSEPSVPVIGVCLVEPYDEADVATANAAIHRLLMSREMSVVPIDTRLDTNATGLRTKAEVESLLARMDAVVTTRLHGTALSLKNGVPVLAVDPERGGGKIVRQASALGWPAVFTVDALNEHALEAALDYCLTEEAHVRARECRDRAVDAVSALRKDFLAAISSAPVAARSRGTRP